MSALCPKYLYLAWHDWTPWSYESLKSCVRARSCKNCGEKPKEIVHDWPDIEQPCRCGQTQRCSRCNAAGRIVEDVVMPHDRSNFTIERCELTCDECNGRGWINSTAGARENDQAPRP